MNPRIKKFLRRIHFGMVLGILVVGYISFYLVETVSYNYTLKRQIDTLQDQLTDLQTQKQTLEYKIQYYQTDDYKEKQARAKLGLQASGEEVIILPHTDAAPKPEENAKQSVSKKSNFQQWIDFLLGRQNSL
ncbi:MAG TPA: septum formation initiator family protein [Candidatus Saccharimonadia bacterium]